MPSVSPRSMGVFLSGCVMVFLFIGFFKASTLFVDEVISAFRTNYFVVGSIYVVQPAVAFIVAGVGGALLQDIRFRSMGVAGGVLFAAGFIYQGLFGYQLHQLFASMLITAVGGGLLHFSVYMTYLEHFPETFSVVFAARELCAYIGMSTMPPFVEAMNSVYGLHGAYLLMGAVACNSVVCGLLLKPLVSGRKYGRKPETNNSAVPWYSCFNPCGSREHPGEWRENEKTSKISTILDFTPFTRHRQFAVFLAIHSLFYYTFTAWAIFLVPFGTSSGLLLSEAVYLSAAGGAGGFLGKILAILIFHLEGMNAIVGALVPSSVICVGLGGYLLSSDYTVLLTSSFLCGLGLAFADSAQGGMLPRYLCHYHLRQGTVMNYLGGGFCMQLGGCISGMILDQTSSYEWLFGTMAVINVLICVIAVVLYNMDPTITECNDRSIEEHVKPHHYEKRASGLEIKYSEIEREGD